MNMKKLNESRHPDKDLAISFMASLCASIVNKNIIIDAEILGVGSHPMIGCSPITNPKLRITARLGDWWSCTVVNLDELERVIDVDYFAELTATDLLLGLAIDGYRNKC